jgi:hypothetical protein
MLRTVYAVPVEAGTAGRRGAIPNPAKTQKRPDVSPAAIFVGYGQSYRVATMSDWLALKITSFMWPPIRPVA